MKVCMYKVFNSKSTILANTYQQDIILFYCCYYFVIKIILTTLTCRSFVIVNGDEWII